MHNITGRQIAAAKVMLGLNSPGLAELTGCHMNTVRRIEGDIGPREPHRKQDLVSVLQSRGITFIENGVKLQAKP